MHLGPIDGVLSRVWRARCSVSDCQWTVYGSHNEHHRAKRCIAGRSRGLRRERSGSFAAWDIRWSAICEKRGARQLHHGRARGSRSCTNCDPPYCCSKTATFFGRTGKREPEFVRHCRPGAGVRSFSNELVEVRKRRCGSFIEDLRDDACCTRRRCLEWVYCYRGIDTFGRSRAIGESHTDRGHSARGAVRRFIIEARFSGVDAREFGQR